MLPFHFCYHLLSSCQEKESPEPSQPREFNTMEGAATKAMGFLFLSSFASLFCVLLHGVFLKLCIEINGERRDS